jgi:hypothetical protein
MRVDLGGPDAGVGPGGARPFIGDIRPSVAVVALDRATPSLGVFKKVEPRTADAPKVPSDVRIGTRTAKNVAIAPAHHRQVRASIRARCEAAGVLEPAVGATQW